MRIAQSIAETHPVDLAIEKSRIAQVFSIKDQGGDKQDALDGYRQALKIQTQQLAEKPTDSSLISNIALTHRRIGDLLKDHPDEAQQEFEAAVNARIALYRSDPENVDWCVGLVTDQIRLGDVRMTNGDRRGALRSYTAAAKIAEEIITKDPTSTIWQRRFAELTVKRGDLLVTRSNEVINEPPQDQSSRIIEMALEAYRNSEHAYEGLLRLSKPPYRELFDVRTKIGDVLVRQNKYPETLKVYRLASQVAQQAAATQRVVDWQIELSNALELTGDLLALRDRDNTEHAKTFVFFYQEALAVLESAASKEPDNHDLQSRRAALDAKIKAQQPTAQ
jgi:tetratricopeptide (TPR) repeat protein